MKTRFLIIGLPRSGTTYLMSLLNSRGDVYCAGELFNPFGMFWQASVDHNHIALDVRDRAPVKFLSEFWQTERAGARAVGLKFMLGHHPVILNAIKADPDLRIIYVHRKNRLAQAASLVKALETKKWATTNPDQKDDRKINVPPRKLGMHMREMATTDNLFRSWLGAVANPTLRVEYQDLITPDFNEEVSAFLDLPANRQMVSQLHKQGPKEVLERFSNQAQIKRWVKNVGLQKWLRPEL